MKRNIRWSILMAVLGFILGLGFLVPLPGTETREPASDRSDGPRMAFVEPHYESDSLPFPGQVNHLEPTTLRPVGKPFFSMMAAPLDARVDVLFDIHTISHSKLAKDTDAYVILRYTDDTRTEIDRFTYCHNYDYDKQAADTSLARFAGSSSPKAYKCYRLMPSDLKVGYTMIDAGIGGKVLVLQSNDFNPKSGGTISIIYANRIRKIGGNDYRSLDMKLVLTHGVATISGPVGAKFGWPAGQTFDWLNITMSEDIFNLPNGLSNFEFFKKGASVKKYSGGDFDKVNKPK